ncbi:unknown [Ruminococcus sp. CAG:379]|nr:unknown [Ruminococcus sp. CAG:379]
MMLRISVSVSSRQLTVITAAPYACRICSHSARASSLSGSVQFSSTTKGFPSSCSSRITRCSHSAYSLRGISEMEPSVVTTSPMVECSEITFRVPTSAAMLKGTSSSNQGVATMRGFSFSMYPRLLGTMYPTQSMSRTRSRAPSSGVIATASSGMNLGSVVIMVFPAADWGSSSIARSRLYSPWMLGITRVSMNRLIKVDLPVRTGPTTPM